jgi:hypothetical protein
LWILSTAWSRARETISKFDLLTCNQIYNSASEL